MKRGFANLPLHGGRAPRWLFARMRKMAGAVAEVICEEFGPEELLARLSDPWWFQAFGCVLGFDWHPYPVNREVYDQSIDFLKHSLDRSKLGWTDKRDALRQLGQFLRRAEATSHP